jgi:heme/copper-type cytochrome/quinol oxidase subunit 3
MKATALVVDRPRPEARRRREPLLADSVLGMLIFVATEVMFFAALLSAFVIIEASAGFWAPPPGVRLPVVATAGNTLILFLSGALLHAAVRRFARDGCSGRAPTLLAGTALLGEGFVLWQGYEWLGLLRYGMTMTSGLFGACFFLLIGTHGLHAAAAVVGLLWLYGKARRRTLRLDQLQAMQLFWGFVVGIWPILYVLVYF